MPAIDEMEKSEAPGSYPMSSDDEKQGQSKPEDMGPMDRSQSDKDGMVIDIPEGVRSFDDAEVGDEVKITFMVRKEDGNKGCLMSADGKQIKGYDHDEEAEGEDNKSGQSFMDAMDDLPQKGGM